jgi:hypothetical protein
MEEAFRLIEKERATNCKLKQFVSQLNQMLFYYKKQWLAPIARFKKKGGWVFFE